MSYCFLEANIISKNELTELDAKPFKEFYRTVKVKDKKIIVDERYNIADHSVNDLIAFWTNYSYTNPDKIIVESYYNNYFVPSQYGIALWQDGFYLSITYGEESFYPDYSNTKIEVNDYIKNCVYVIGEDAFLPTVMNFIETLKKMDFSITHFDGEEITNEEIIDIINSTLREKSGFIRYLKHNTKRSNK